MQRNAVRRSHRRNLAIAGRDAEERVFQAVLDAILDHRLAPGTKLVERELSELLGASRGAVRAALARLGHSLLVELRPNRGAVIANPSVSQTRDLFEARRIVEAGIVRAVATRMTPSIRSRLRDFVAGEVGAYAKGDTKTGQRLSIQFHKLLAEIAGNTVLDHFMEHLICRTPLLALAHTGHSLSYCGASEHRAIVDALLHRDADAAVALMDEHLAHLESQLHLDDRVKPVGLAEALGVAGPQVRPDVKSASSPGRRRTGKRD